MSVLLVDANNLAYRNFYAQNLKTKSGQNTGMIYGFINSMMSAIKEVNPDEVYYVWDPPGGSTYRKNLYKLYKGNRDAQVPEFYEEMALLKQLLGALSCTQITKPGVETDDILGYLSLVRFADQTVINMSNDKDILQIMSGRVTVLHPDKGILLVGADGKIPIKEQNKTIHIRPDQVPDFKALVGDPSDNYPGLPGFGIGAAINYFELNERALAVVDGTARLSNQRSTVLNSVITNRGMVSLWLQLATLNIEEGEVTIPERPQREPEMVSALFEHLEFNQFRALGDMMYRIGGR